ncbi:MAG: monooxygenase [Devosia sp.]|uniref:monooxygenase n=1 Tax=Devosia sp. TaxID=1871048 RepID=UPI00260B4284|nr:monooxygenase [Devosia sp.]MDB5538816.1 monooxygenase [Devosia sp.]
MHCVLWTYKTPAGLTKKKADALFLNVADKYVGVPGLVRKYFGYSEDGTAIVGVYLWQSKAAADAFYSPEWFAGVTSRWGAAPDRADWQIPQVVESVSGEVITEMTRVAAE